MAAKIEKRTRKSHPMEVKIKSWSQFKYEVIAREGKEGKQKKFAYQVQLLPPNQSTCGCQKPDLTGIPCSHVIAVINERKLDIRDFVHQYYSAENLFITWQPGFEPPGTRGVNGPSSSELG